MEYYKKLKNKIITKKAIICIIGLGYVGGAILKRFEKNNFKIIGIDNDKKKITKKNNNKNVFLSNNYKHVENADVIIITLPTPLTKNLNPDLSYIKNSLEKMKRYLKMKVISYILKLERHYIRE